MLFAAGKIEKWGRGTLDMIKLCKQSGNPVPIFEETSGSFSVIFPLKESLSRHPRVLIPSMQLTDRQQEIIEILKEGPLKTQQIMDKMSIKLTDRVMQLELSKLRKIGVIKSTGRTKTTIWTLSN